MIRVVRPEVFDRVYTSERLRRQLTAAWPSSTDSLAHQNGPHSIRRTASTRAIITRS